MRALTASNKALLPGAAYVLRDFDNWCQKWDLITANTCYCKLISGSSVVINKKGKIKENHYFQTFIQSNKKLKE